MFPVSANGEGPFWDLNGIPICFDGVEPELVRILAVPLGNDLFRLAENPLFEPLTELKWGDDFFAELSLPDRLKLKRVLTPKKYRHAFNFISGPSLEGSKISDRIHELGGGWERVAGGMLTVTLPAENWHLFTEFGPWSQSAFCAIGEQPKESSQDPG